MTARWRSRSQYWGTLLLVLALAVALSACGFRLRGSFNISPELQPIYVDASGRLRNSLHRSLDFAGVERASSRSEAASILRVLSFDQDREVLTTDLDGRADEIELIARARFRVEDARAREEDEGMTMRALISESELDVRRTYRYDAEAVLAQDEQEEQLRQDLLADLTDQILFRLEAWQP